MRSLFITRFYSSTVQITSIIFWLASRTGTLLCRGKDHKFCTCFGMFMSFCPPMVEGLRPAWKHWVAAQVTTFNGDPRGLLPVKWH